MILIIGNSSDKAKTVVNEIKKISKKKIVIFKADKCLEGEAVGFSLLNNRAMLFADINGKGFDLNEATSVWYWKPLLPKVLRIIEPVRHQIFIHRQFLTIWRSITSCLSDRMWINDYYKLLEAENKPYQIKLASEIGFDVPDTLITSSPKRAVDFWGHCNKQMIIKTLIVSQTEDSMIYTNKVTEEIMLKIERLKSSPVILQKLIPAKYGLRITVVGDDIFSARVESDSEIDWRRSEIRLKKYHLPEEIKDKCFCLVKKLGLKYGCIDMILTPDGRYVFLEINPNGQWCFVAERTGMPIGEAIAHLLVHG